MCNAEGLSMWPVVEITFATLHVLAEAEATASWRSDMPSWRRLRAKGERRPTCCSTGLEVRHVAQPHSCRPFSISKRKCSGTSWTASTTAELTRSTTRASRHDASASCSRSRRRYRGRAPATISQTPIRMSGGRWAGCVTSTCNRPHPRPRAACAADGAFARARPPGPRA